jgi:NAD(P)-dependent dehydrogenase (short-subunit alcohol dehydrogenase family)
LVQDKVVIVTGGLGQIGAEFVKALHERGAKVAIFGRSVSPDRVGEALGDIATSQQLSFHAVDITRKETIEAALDAVEDQHGAPDALLNNAGIDPSPAPRRRCPGRSRTSRSKSSVRWSTSTLSARFW